MPDEVQSTPDSPGARPSRLRRTLRIAAGGCLVVAGLGVVGLLVVMVSVVRTQRWQLLDPAGKPLPGATVAFHYYGHRFNLVDSLVYERPGGLLRAGRQGRFEIPGFVHLHRPLDSALDPFIDLIYVPSLHNAFGPVGALSEPVSSRRTIDRKRGTIAPTDLSDKPGAWLRTLDRLRELVVYDLAPAPQGAHRPQLVPASAEERRQLARQTLRELEQFLARYAETPRPPPREPSPPSVFRSEQERQEQLARMQAAYAREPLWGDVARHWRKLHGGQLEKLAEPAATR